MKYIEKLETKVIEYTGDAADFEKRLNKILTELGEEELEVELRYIEQPTLIAIATYTRKYSIGATLEDAYHLEKIYPKCKDCPHFKPYDDKRLSRGMCQKKDRLVHKKENACETYYEELETTEVIAYANGQEYKVG